MTKEGCLDLPLPLPTVILREMVMSTSLPKPVYRCACLVCQQHPRGATARLHASINRVMAGLDEKNRRRFAGLWASQWGRGGIQRLHEITGLSRPTIARGQWESKQEPGKASRRIRRPGGGRPRAEKNGPVS
jgi:hypothetical protein